MEPNAKETESTTVNSPDIDSSCKVRRRAITSGQQAYSIARQLEDGNKSRNDLNSVILKKYNGGQPYDSNALIQNKEDWRSNAPTGFMSSIVDRITPTPMHAIDAARYLTSASLDDGNPESEKKSELFRQHITRAIRKWNGWRDFLSSLCQEDVLIGQAAPLRLNPYSPWPKMFKGNEVFFPEGTGQHAKTAQVLSVKEDLLIHEFVEFFKDYPDIDGGWEFENCIKVVNDSLPKSSANTEGSQDARSWQDAIREGNLGASQSGAKIVELYHTLAVEPDSLKVTHYIVNRRGEHETLYCKEDRFENMEDVLTLFTLQPANGRYYASKGIGRMLLNLHIAIERSRNSMLDNLNLSSLKILKTPAGQSPALQLKMSSPLMVVSTDGDFDQHGIQVNISEYVAADDQVAKWAEQLVGSYISGLGSQEGGERTATEATIEANRDAQAKTAFLARFWGQFADLIGQITRGLCDPESTDEIAKEVRKCLLDEQQVGLTEEELDKLANAPAAEVVQDLTQMHNQQVISAFTLLRGDPNIDQDQLYTRFLSAAVSPQFAEDVFLDKQGLQANEAEAVRQQMMETEAIISGAPGMPVSPRDPHDIHLKTIFSDLKGGISKIAHNANDDPSVLDKFNAQLVHSSAHIKMMKEFNADPKVIQQFEQAQKMFEGLLDHIAGEVKRGRMAESEAQTPEPQQPTPAPTPPSALPMTEKLATAWIGQYDKLPDMEKRELEKLTGLTPEGVQPPEAQSESVMPISAPMPAPAAPTPIPPPTEATPLSEEPEEIPQDTA